MALPCLFQLGHNRVWRTYQGGRNLDILEGKRDPADSHFPEDWIASTTPASNKGREHLTDEGLSRVEFEGVEILLRDLMVSHRREILGESHFKSFGAQTGFLAKLLDSAIRLPIQCHPTIPFAQEHLGASAGKTEAYVILRTREEVSEPHIYLGFQRPPSPEAFRQAIVDQDMETMLGCFDKIPVCAGDVFLVPGGIPHAIGEGILMIEIMEPTDFAVRVEFTCGGFVIPEELRFMGRDVDFAVSMFDFNAISEEEIRARFFGTPRLVADWGEAGREVSVVDKRLTSCFAVNRLSVKGEVTRRHEGFYILVITGGNGMLEGPDGVRLAARFGDRFLVPAHAGQVRFYSREGIEAVLALPPKGT